jgi:hypothetical protein
VPGDVETLEAELLSIPEVRAARVITATNGRITEVHIVSEGGKAPKQLVRDVQTVAQARLGVPIDHRIVSVVQFPGRSSGPSSLRFILSSVSWSTEGMKATCRVRLESGDETLLGEASGPATSLGRARLIAEATTSALGSLEKDPPVADIADVRVVDVGAHKVAVAVVILLAKDGSEGVVTGSAPVRSDENESIVRAILDAVGRNHGA